MCVDSVGRTGHQRHIVAALNDGQSSHIGRFHDVDLIDVVRVRLVQYMDLERISQWLGHSQLETTLIYAHADTEDKRKAIEAALGGGVTGELHNEPYTVDDEEILRKLYGL